MSSKEEKFCALRLKAEKKFRHAVVFISFRGDQRKQIETDALTKRREKKCSEIKTEMTQTFLVTRQALKGRKTLVSHFIL